MFVQSSLSDLITYKDMKLKKGEFNEKLVAGWSLGQVLGYDGCYDSGTCPHGYRGLAIAGPNLFLDHIK